MTREELIEKLINIGFEFTTNLKGYRCELTTSNETQTLSILIRKRGIDYLFDEIHANEDENLEVEKVKNGYNGSDINLHGMTLKLASKFIKNSKLDDYFFENHGNSNRRVRKTYSGSPRMVEGFERTSRGEDYVYMGDGTYIHPDDAWW